MIAYQALGPPRHSALENAVIQLQEGRYRGRTVIPMYMEMDGEHPDYTRQQRGGCAVWKGQMVQLETHTYVPEMASTYMNLPDDEGKT